MDLEQPLVTAEASHQLATLRYSEEVAARVLEEYESGKMLAEIAREPGMPSYGALMRWAKQNPSFRHQLKAAREVRALHFEELALYSAESAEENPHKDAAALGRLKFDAYRWAAEMSDPATYGKKTTISGDPDRPLRFVIHSGFPEPNEHQTPPELGPDGLIVQKVGAATKAALEEVLGPEEEESELGSLTEDVP